MFGSSFAGAQVPKVERVIEIGCEDCGDARQFASTWDVMVTEAGNVLVVDRDAPTLRLFDKAGKSLWTRGRPGSGPGEYRFAMRAALGRDGVVQVVDMRSRRLTRLAPDGTVSQSLTVPFFPAGIGVRRQTGELVFMTDDFKGGGTLQRWPQSVDTPTKVATFATPTPGEATAISPSVAVAPNGDIAYLVSGDTYRVARISAAGTALADITRDIPRPKRTPQELAAVEKRIGSMGAAKAAAEGKQSSAAKPLMPSTASRFEFKSHAATDGLRYDDAGRLWLRTNRGAGRTTVFDVFSALGGYVGEVTVPIAVESYSLAGSYLATATERADGIPVVILWTVR
jgi:hypothetical protein